MDDENIEITAAMQALRKAADESGFGQFISNEKIVEIAYAIVRAIREARERTENGK
jgi:predicted nucleic-acid-binding protein